LSTGGLCQYTPRGEGTSQSILLVTRFSIAPLMPVISAFGILALLAMSPPVVDQSRHEDTGGGLVVTHGTYKNCRMMAGTHGPG
jgi:hypothetical protein